MPRVDVCFQEAIRHVDQWSKPKPVAMHLVTFPSTQFMQPEPLGVALVISTWNYPLLLALTPVVGSIAAGNVTVLKPVRRITSQRRLLR